MTQPGMRVTPRTTLVEQCEQCEEPITERWDEDKRRCARCSLDAELFDREERRQRISLPA